MKFAEIVRSSPQVRDAFCDAGAYSFWWRLILALHGKPGPEKLSATELRLVLARGFRFYASVYLALSVTFLFAAVVAGCSGLPDFWIWLLVSASGYLLATSRLAFVGSRNYLKQTKRARPQLVTFFVSIIAFLSCFCGFCAAIVQFAVPSHGYIVFLGLATLLTFGIGSYVIEIVYLVTDPSRAEVN